MEDYVAVKNTEQNLYALSQKDVCDIPTGKKQSADHIANGDLSFLK